MHLWLKIFLSLIIMFVVALIALAILQINDYSMPGLSAAIGFMAGFLFFIYAPAPPNSRKNALNISKRNKNLTGLGALVEPDELLPAEYIADNLNETNTKARDINLPDQRSSSANPWKSKPTSTPKHSNASNKRQQAIKEEKNTQENDVSVWSEEFSILYEYDPIVQKCFDELWDIDTELATRFREEIILDRKKSIEIKDRLKAEFEKEKNPYNSDELNNGLSKARKLGSKAEQEFVRVVEVMGDDIDVDSITERLEEKYNPSKLSEIDELNVWGIRRSEEGFAFKDTTFGTNVDALEHAKKNLKGVLNKAGFSEFKRLLSKYGYNFEPGGNGRFKISKDDYASNLITWSEVHSFVEIKIGPKKVCQFFDD
jgi:hypothetical protein